MDTRRYTLANRPTGKPTPEDFAVESHTLRDPGPGEVMIEVTHVSVDPYMRDRMAPGESYADAWDVGDPIPAGAVGRVRESAHPQWEAGDLVTGVMGWAEDVVVDGDHLDSVDTDIAPPPAYLGVLGLTGRTAYFGMLEVANPDPGDTVVVSGAAGAVGSVAGQLAQLAGGRVIGIAGTEQKTTYLTDELGFSGAINYDSTSVPDALDDHCPDGIDVYFDNVGGPITDAVFPRLSEGATVAVCGQIALYNQEEMPTGPRKLWQLVGSQARAEGFLVGQFSNRYAEANSRLGRWVQSKTLQSRRTTIEGFDRIPEAFRGLFEGRNIGKLIVELGETSTT